MAIGAVAAVAASLRCTDAARELARLAARGEADRGRAVAARLAPTGARIVLQIRGDEAVAEVTAPPVRLLPVHVRGKAVPCSNPVSRGSWTLRCTATHRPQAPSRPASPRPLRLPRRAGRREA